MKRSPVYIAALALALLLCTALPAAAKAPDADAITTKNVLLMDADTGAILFEKNADERALPASTTKIMTCILALENGDLDARVYVPSVTNRGSIMGIKKGEKMSLRSLMYGMMLVSGNDAAEAIAVFIGGTKDDFLKMMNDKAKELGMKDTHFAEPSGLQNEEHYTTARDFAILTRYALMESPKKGDFRALAKKPTYAVKDSSRDKLYNLESTNKLIHTKEKNGVKNPSFEYRYAIGVKTGSTPAAAECLVAAAEKDGVTLISVQFNEQDGDYRFKLATELFNWGFENLAKESAAALNLPATLSLPYTDEEGNTADLALQIDLSGITVSCLQEEMEKLRTDPQCVSLHSDVQALSAPVTPGAVLGTVEYRLDGKLLFSADACAPQTLPARAAADPITGQLEGGDAAGGSDVSVLTGDAPEEKGGVWRVLLPILLGIALIVAVLVILRMRKLHRRRSRRRHRY